VLFVDEKLAKARLALDSLGAVPWLSDDLASGLISDRLIDDLARELANAADDDSAHPLAT
jgi:hypothetical protein